MTDEEAATRLFMAISDNELWQKMQQSGACIGDLLFIEALVKAIKTLGERKRPDAITGLVPCGCGGKPVFERTGDEQHPVMAQCSECYVRTDDMADEYWAKERWNRSQGYIEEDKDYD